MAKTKVELGTTPSRSEQLERYGECVNGVCVVGEGEARRLEVHLDGSNPICAEFVKLVGPAAMMGVPTSYSVDEPEARPAPRKR